jgi:hypothetical protein
MPAVVIWRAEFHSNTRGTDNILSNLGKKRRMRNPRGGSPAKQCHIPEAFPAIFPLRRTPLLHAHRLIRSQARSFPYCMHPTGSKT